MSDDMTKNAKAFKKANDESPVIEGKVNDLVHGGGTYWLRDGRNFVLTADEARSLPEGYPKWGY